MFMFKTKGEIIIKTFKNIMGFDQFSGEVRQTQQNVFPTMFTC